MSSQPVVVEMIVKHLGAGVTAQKMFGEYAVYCDDVVIALVCDDRLYLKDNGDARALLGTVELAPPYPGGKPAIVVPEHVWDDASRMRQLARVTRDAVVTSRTKSPTTGTPKKPVPKKPVPKKPVPKKAAAKRRRRPKR